MQGRGAVSIVFYFVAVVLSGGSRAQGDGQATLRVFVAPAHAIVDVVGDSLSHMTRSGAVLELPAGTYDVVLQASGFESHHQVVELEPEMAETLRVQLREADPSARSHEGWRGVSWGTLVFLIVFVVAYLGYLTLIQRRFYGVSIALAGTVSNLRTVTPPSIAGVAAAAESRARSAPPQELTVTGPADMRIGQPSAPFVARGTAAPFMWSLEPAEAGRVMPGPDANVVSVIANAPGLLKLTASAGGQEASLHAAALPHQGGTWHLPWVGAGHGSILLAVIVTGALVVLGVLGILESGVIGTILGTIAGLMFGRAASDRDRQPRNGPQNQPPPPASP